MFIARLKDKYSSDRDAICNLYDDNEISIFHAVFVTNIYMNLSMGCSLLMNVKNKAGRDMDIIILLWIIAFCAGMPVLEILFRIFKIL